jgi:hypothetical protein
MIMSLQSALHHAFCLVYMGHSKHCQRIAPSIWFMGLKLLLTTVKKQTRTKEEEDNILQWSTFVLFTLAL